MSFQTSKFPISTPVIPMDRAVPVTGTALASMGVHTDSLNGKRSVHTDEGSFSAQVLSATGGFTVHTWISASLDKGRFGPYPTKAEAQEIADAWLFRAVRGAF